ncbi:MAG: hypothetical protein KC422_23860 [Trueperaceae bacterium]|nr:hypothetical protein [Trueperaceae bacterium]
MKLIQSSPALNPCKEVHDLAAKVYQAQDVLSAKILEHWWSAYPQLFWLVYEDETLCGYTSALPLTRDAFAKTLTMDFDEKAIQAIDILPFEQVGEYQIYFSSIVVHPVWRSKGVSQVLRQAFLQGLLNLYANDKRTTALSSWVVSERGSKMMASLGMQLYRQAQKGAVYYAEQSKEKLASSLTRLSG